MNKRNRTFSDSRFPNNMEPQLKFTLHFRMYVFTKPSYMMQIIQMLLFIQEKGHLGNREVNYPIDKI